jgi:magnesium and cobalt transporter
MKYEYQKPSLTTKLMAFFSGEKDERSQLLTQLREAEQHGILDSDAISMIEGVFQVSELRVRDIMVPRSHMVVIKGDFTVKDMLPLIVNSGHSRFPVVDESLDEIIGILLAKDLVPYSDSDSHEKFELNDILRPAVFVPESKRLNVLLKDFRSSRNHMAIVVDEYGGVAGLVTIEDVLEQIVGDIEDEYDFDEASDNILPEPGGRFRVKALTQIADFNAVFGTEFPDEEHDTVGGLVIAHLGRLPKRGESLAIAGLKFQVLRADSRRVYTLIVEKPRP